MFVEDNVCLTKWQPSHAVSYLALWSQFGWGNLPLSAGGIEKKLWDFQNAQTVSLQNFCYIVQSEVCCSTVQLHNLCTCTPLVTSNYFPVLPIHVFRQHSYLIFSFSYWIKHHSWIYRGKFVDQREQGKIYKYYKYEQRNQQRANNPTLGPPRYKQHSGLFK